MATVTFKHVTKIYQAKKGKVRAVDDLSLEIAEREFLVLVGPSGCGKTTTLRLVAGLEEVGAGTIHIADRVVNDVPPKDRDIAMVFQNYALYPHMTVFKNMAFGLKMRRVPKDDIKRKVLETAAMLGIEHLLDRKPAALSGGERQRVAVGRAIVRTPQVFLFDEPLSNLDAKLRVHMRTEIKSLHRKLRTTIIYVTHDQEEAMTLGDRLVIMNRGVVQQCGAPLEVYNRPANRFVAGFIGTPMMNFLEGSIKHEGESVFFAGGSGLLPFPPQQAEAVKPHVGQAVVLGIRPEHLRIDGGAARFAEPDQPERQSAAAASFKTSVTAVEPLGDTLNVHLVAAEGEPLIARMPPTVSIAGGDEVSLAVDMSRVHVFAFDEDGRRLN